MSGPNLFIRSKWHTRERNVAVGDIVWVSDQNALRGHGRLARVIDVNTDKKGVVRDVKVGTFPSSQFPQQNLSGGQKLAEQKQNVQLQSLQQFFTEISGGLSYFLWKSRTAQ